MTHEPDEPVAPSAQTSGRSGRAIVSLIVENTAVSPSGGPSSDDCYTTLLHNPGHDLGSSSGKRSGKRAGGCLAATFRVGGGCLWRCLACV